MLRLFLRCVSYCVLRRTALRAIVQPVALGSACLLAGVTAAAAEPDHVLNVWPGKPPGATTVAGEEQDFTKPDDRPVAGRRIIKLGNVSTPQLHVYLPPVDQRTGAALVICPGGGFQILAWDLEGTEVAEWLNSLGITAIVLKYRVPTRELTPKWEAPVQDTQRALSLVRQHAAEWGLQPDRIGVLGFSAGGETAGRAALAVERTYPAMDAVDDIPCRADLAVLIYPAYLVNEARTGLREDVVVSKDSPPMFLAHAFDDPVAPETSVFLLLALKQSGVPSELHIYDAGGHGYGLRPVENLPVTGWSARCADWLRRRGWCR